MYATMAWSNQKTGGLLMLNNLFQVYYLICLIVGSFIRVWYGRKYRQDRKAIFRKEGLAYALLASLWGMTILIPIVHMFTRWLSFADYDLPAWAGWIGIVIFAVALWLLWRAHANNWWDFPIYSSSYIFRPLVVGNCPGAVNT